MSSKHVYLLYSEPTILDECDLDEKTKEVLITNINRRMMPQAVKVRSDIEVSCYGYEGIDAIKEALRQGVVLSTEELPIKVNNVINFLYRFFYNLYISTEFFNNIKSILHWERIRVLDRKSNIF